MYQKKSSILKHWDFILLDLICLEVSFVIAYMIRHGLENPYMIPRYRNMAIIMTLITAFLYIYLATFKNVLKRTTGQEFVATFKQIALLELIAVGYLFLVQESFEYSRITMFLTAVVYALTSFPTRLLLKMALLKNGSRRKKKALLIITSSDEVKESLENIEDNALGIYKISGIVLVDKDCTGEEIEGIPVVAGRNNLSEYICHQWIDEVLVDMPVAESNKLSDILDDLAEMGAVVHVRMAKAYGGEDRKQLVEKVGKRTVITTTINFGSTGQIVLKRAFDILGGIVGCVITGILLILLGPVIYIMSKGPVFFAQERVGRNGKKFKMYKFRSMYMDAEERKKELMEKNNCKDDLMFKMEDDPRIIGNKLMPDGTVKKGFGAFMRKFSLDEWPQFFNVLKGEMSLVGTRPPTVDEWEKYELRHRARLSTKPGITGMWQVSGRSEITDFEEVVKLDLEYINKWSLGLDMKIIFKTIGVVLKGHGAS